MKSRTFQVEHETRYHYDSPVHLEPHTIRLRPRMTTTQQLLDYKLDIHPAPSGVSESLDQDGNLALHAWFDGEVSELKIASHFRVELFRQNPFDFNLLNQSQNLPLWYRNPLSEALTSYRYNGHVNYQVTQFAQSVAAETQWALLPFLTSLNLKIFNSFRHVTRPEGPAWLSGQTIAAGEGSCRDLAVLFCDLCRAMGIAARFVSGYECASAGQEDESTMHAWAEVYLPAAGWRGYDPSRGLAVADGHVVVAAGFEPSLAAPISGLFSGAFESRMETRLHVTCL